MKRTAATIALLATVADVLPARAEFPKLELPRLGIFRKKKDDPPAPAPAPTPAKPTPNAPAAQPPEQIPAQPEPVASAANAAKNVLETLKTDRDEKRRVAASEALRAVDPRVNPDVVPALTNALQQDPSATVRASLAETIGKLKPVSQQTGAILEQAVVADPSEAVRKAAQQALWQYHLNGYRSSSANSATPQTAEPPLAKPKTLPRVPTAVLTSKTGTPESKPTPSSLPPLRPITTGIGRGAIYPQTVEPPLAREKVGTPAPVEAIPEPIVELKPPTPSIVVPPLPKEPLVEKQPELSLPAISIPLPPASAPLVPSIPPPGK